MIAPNEATERQIQAARPSSSTWLSANAGSGKTRVLTDRVARLLLNGVQPQHILCLTYTKAAAGEMQNRLFERLGKWAMLGDTKLTVALTELGDDGAIDPTRLAHARTLFARAIETPGGLKIQTIHSFCASLLRRFPLEAGVSPQFSEMEDRAAEMLRADIIDEFADGDRAPLIDAIARYATDSGLDDLTKAIVSKREAFGDSLRYDELLKVFELPNGFTDADLKTQVFLGNEADLIRDLSIAMNTGSVTDVKTSKVLSKITNPGINDLPVLEKYFLAGAASKTIPPYSAKLDSFPTKATRLANPELMAKIEPFMLRIEAARSQRLGLMAAQKSFALHQFADAFLPEYARRKQIGGWLDFDDQILKARQLLNNPSVAAWVLYRLDGGIDHILVDEAQDTSPAQWDVIEKLAQEFTSGLGVRPDVERTIFVVGDKKQSIYSFQGADPDAFDRMQAEFANRLENTGISLEDLTLEYSFRSSDAILRLVDLVFQDLPNAGFRKGSQHRAFKSDLPGRVDLWPVIAKVDDDAERVWTDPVDRQSEQHHTVILAERIAASIKDMIDNGATIPVDGREPGTFEKRRIRAGDFLILVQRRSDLFAEIIRACKAAKLPIAGADRLKVGAELAVKDLAALLNFLVTPEDSLALATVLKSPLFGWSEQDLFDLAHYRDGPYLWPALRDRADEFPETMTMLNDLRNHTDFLRPFDLIERILTRHDGRRKLLGRLGTEAEDGIDALLSQALAYERSSVPSLTGFLIWMETDDLDVKRQMGSAGDLIRVMTVHGAKGLESPIVILPDTGPRRPPPNDEIMVANGTPLWRINAAEMPDALKTVQDNARYKQMNERLRLLYVALTRAEKWLIVAAAGDLDKQGNSWYQMVEAAMIQANAEPVKVNNEQILRLSHMDWEQPGWKAATPEMVQVSPLPDLFASDPPPESPSPLVLAPSDLGGAKALPGDDGQDEDIAMLRGSQIHLLLEHLPGYPQQNWSNVVDHMLSETIESERSSLLSEVSKSLTHPDLAHIFVPTSLAEVPVTATIEGHKVYGVIDRLIVTQTSVLAVDFKSNATVPDDSQNCPEGLLRQMGAYAHVLAQIYPNHRVETAILWTRNANLMQLSHDLVTDALWRSPHLDVGGPHS
ncbi:MAG: double-strand break repair helicase AddA [Rhodobacteraceae bacterium]|nr:double-strand break repair helicase AddA [Paracoccaceae bacterium]